MAPLQELTVSHTLKETVLRVRCTDCVPLKPESLTSERSIQRVADIPPVTVN